MKKKKDKEPVETSTMSQNLIEGNIVDDRGITEQQKQASQALDESKAPLKLPNDEGMVE